MKELPEFLKAGAVLLINQNASVQFSCVRPFMFRLIRIVEHTHLSEYVWLDGYQLKKTGVAVCRRDIYVRIRGVVEFNSLVLKPPIQARTNIRRVLI